MHNLSQISAVQLFTVHCNVSPEGTNVYGSRGGEFQGIE